MSPFKVIVLLSLALSIHGYCQLHTTCTDCIMRKCVFYESTLNDFCSHNRVPRTTYKVKIRSLLYCHDENPISPSMDSEIPTSSEVSRVTQITATIAPTFLFKSEMSTATLFNGEGAKSEAANPLNNEGVEWAELISSPSTSIFNNQTIQTSDTFEIRGNASIRGTEWSAKKKEFGSEILLHQCRMYGSIRKLFREKQGKPLSQENFEKIVRRCTKLLRH